MTTPTQPTLLGLDLTDQSAPRDAHCLFGIQGRLAEDAHAWDNDAGQILLQVVVLQAIHGHPNAVPIVATFEFTGTRRADEIQAARAKAARLPAGTDVTVVGIDLQPGKRAGEPVLKLLHTFAIERSDHLPGPALQPPAHLRGAAPSAPSSNQRSQEVSSHAH